MKLKKLFGFRVILLLIVVVLMLMAINYDPFAEGVQVKDVKGVAQENGVKIGDNIVSINDELVDSVETFNSLLEKYGVERTFTFDIETDQGSFSYNRNDLGFRTFNLTITEVEEDVPLEQGMKILKINNNLIDSIDSYYEVIDEIVEKNKFNIETDKEEIVFLIAGKPEITVEQARKSNLRTGLEISGGTRVLLQPESKEGEVTDKNVNDLIAVLNERLNVYGLTDMKIRSAKDWEGVKYVLIEIAGVGKEEVEELISKQGVFEAKIGDDLVFSGGKHDIPYVCRGDGTCSGVRDCRGDNEEASCRFEFVIHLSPDAAKRHADVTRNLKVNSSETGDYLEKNIDFYLDEKLVDSLRIGADLKGQESTQILISGPGYGPNQAAAYDNAVDNMNKLQTILITGSLPLDLNIVKLDSISPVLGKQFIKNAYLVGILAILSVAVVAFIRYRRFKIMIPMIFTSLSEVIIILGFAALIRWNLDLVSIAGIIAAVGTGVDDQIVVIDEIVAGAERFINWKNRIKRAFFIIMAAYATTLAAMIPLFLAGAGLIKGFAVTTIVGITVGVFLTRPAFAQIVQKLLEE